MLFQKYHNYHYFFIVFLSLYDEIGCTENK